MEEIISRFPHIGEAFYKELNRKDFCKSMEVNRSWNFFMNNQRVLQNAYKKRIQDKIQTLAEKIDGHGFWRHQRKLPFHLAAERGYLPVCQQIMENADDKNPKDQFGMTPLHKAAWNGHLAVCQLIVENVDDKNPKDDDGWTPLHWAALYGHLSVCWLIVKNVSDKNPENNDGETPVQLAVSRNYQGIKKLIEDAQNKQV